MQIHLQIYITAVWAIIWLFSTLYFCNKFIWCFLFQLKVCSHATKTSTQTHTQRLRVNKPLRPLHTKRLRHKHYVDRQNGYPTHSAGHIASHNQRYCPSMLRWRRWSRLVWTDLKAHWHDATAFATMSVFPDANNGFYGIKWNWSVT